MLQIKLQYYFYVSHGDQNTVKYVSRIALLFEEIQFLLTQPVFLMNTYKYFKAWYYWIIY